VSKVVPLPKKDRRFIQELVFRIFRQLASLSGMPKRIECTIRVIILHSTSAVEGIVLIPESLLTTMSR